MGGLWKNVGHVIDSFLNGGKKTWWFNEKLNIFLEFWWRFNEKYNIFLAMEFVKDSKEYWNKMKFMGKYFINVSILIEHF